MISFERLNNRKGSVYRVLCLGAHPDDIEIGCGGTTLKLIQEHKKVDFLWVVFSGGSARAVEAQQSADLFLCGSHRQRIVVKDFTDSFFPYVGPEIKEYFHQLRTEFDPDVIFTHCRHDLHQDHRLISELTWNTFRQHLILEYEVPKYDGDLGSPNGFVHLNKSLCKKKVQYIVNCFKSQKDKQWFRGETFLSLMRLRGIESIAPSSYAEAFYCRKMIL